MLLKILLAVVLFIAFAGYACIIVGARSEKK